MSTLPQVARFLASAIVLFASLDGASYLVGAGLRHLNSGHGQMLGLVEVLALPLVLLLIFAARWVAGREARLAEQGQAE